MTTTKTNTKLVGYCAVDSGQILLTDPAYVGSFLDGEEFQPTVGKSLHPYSYNGACGATLGEEQAGQLCFALGQPGAGVAVASGYGDGMYPVYAEYNSEGRIARVTIEFVSDEDDDDDEGDE